MHLPTLGTRKKRCFLSRAPSLYKVCNGLRTFAHRYSIKHKMVFATKSSMVSYKCGEKERKTERETAKLPRPIIPFLKRESSCLWACGPAVLVTQECCRPAWRTVPSLWEICCPRLCLPVPLMETKQTAISYLSPLWTCIQQWSFLAVIAGKWPRCGFRTPSSLRIIKLL